MAEEKTRLQLHLEAKKRREVEIAKALERRERNLARLKTAANAVCKTKAGQDFFVGLFHLCGYNRPAAVADPATGEVLDNSTQYNDARRSVYIDVRKYIDPEMRGQIETLAETVEEKEK